MRQFQNATFILDKSEKSFSLQDKKKYDCLMMKFKKYHYPEDIKTKHIINLVQYIHTVYSYSN